jgi:hypothetical protein
VAKRYAVPPGLESATTQDNLVGTVSEATVPQIDVVLDTNVLLDVHSCHDVSTTYQRLFYTMGAAAVNDASVVYRRARARESFLLALFFNKNGLTTCSLRAEAVDILIRRVPPAPGEATSLELAFTELFIWFVKDYLLPNWKAQAAGPGVGWEKTLSAPALLTPELLTPGHPELENPTGSRADAWHIAEAKELRVPLVSNEGFNPAGYETGKIKRRATEEGVSAYFPHEFYGGKMNEADEIGAFFERFTEEAPRYLDAKRQELGADRTGEALDFVFGYYRFVLLGETAPVTG